MINGAHIVIYTKDPEADRAFFRDILKFSSVDAGHDWLIFAMPPLEAAYHDSDNNDQHELYLMCDDIAATLKDLKSKNQRFCGARCRDRAHKSSPESWEYRNRLRNVGLAKLSDLWETVTMTQPELTDVSWLGPRDEMDRASHRLGKCSECHEIICVEKAVTDTQNTQPETNEMLYKAFRTHVKLKHSEDFSQAATRIMRETTEN